MDTSPVKLAVIALGIIAAFVLGMALLMRTGETSAQQASAQAAGSFFSEQQKMMREALSMAKEAQAMQRQRMQEMRAAMQEAEGYAYEGAPPIPAEH